MCSVLVGLAVGLVAWCVWRFFKKKRPKDKKKGKDGKDQVTYLSLTRMYIENIASVYQKLDRTLDSDSGSNKKSIFKIGRRQSTGPKCNKRKCNISVILFSFSM